MQKLIFIFLFFTCLYSCKVNSSVESIVEPGAYQTELYFKLLVDKKVGLVVNHTSIIGKNHLVDSLLSAKIEVIKIFAPEHGFRGTKDAGEYVEDEHNKSNEIEIVSLHGRTRKPTHEKLHNIDIMVFDIQDVGVRFYTYISTLHYVMEACAENELPLIVLDRPNPNGHYIDGPVLEEKYKSFLGMHKIPLVHGLTMGEMAQMINGEGWLINNIACELTVIKCKNYTHKSYYSLPVNPSPNLKSMRAIYLYPTLGLFEGTVMSVGRGTISPFEVVGHPLFSPKDFSFKPTPMIGATSPKYKNKLCYGVDFRNLSIDSLRNLKKIDISILIDVYKAMNYRKDFFDQNFNFHSGNSRLQQEIKNGNSEKEIRQSWDKDIFNYLNIRKKYLLYEDF